MFSLCGKYHCSDCVSSRAPRERRHLKEKRYLARCTCPSCTTLILVSAVLLRASCPLAVRWYVFLSGSASVRSACPNFVASDHMIKVFSFRTVFGLLRLWVRETGRVLRAPVHWEAAVRCHERVMVAHGSLLLQAQIDHRWVVGVSSCCVVVVLCPLPVHATKCCRVTCGTYPENAMCGIRDVRARENAQFTCPCTAGTADTTAAPGDTRKSSLIQHQTFQRLTCMARAQT